MVGRDLSATTKRAVWYNTYMFTKLYNRRQVIHDTNDNTNHRTHTGMAPRKT